MKEDKKIILLKKENLKYHSSAEMMDNVSFISGLAY